MTSCIQSDKNRSPEVINSQFDYEIYITYCSNCHRKEDTQYGAPSLVQMSKDNKSTLLNKFKKIDGDKNHRDIFTQISKKETDNIINYIINYKPIGDAIP
jgi:cytochrome c553